MPTATCKINAREVFPLFLEFLDKREKIEVVNIGNISEWNKPDSNSVLEQLLIGHFGTVFSVVSGDKELGQLAHYPKFNEGTKHYQYRGIIPGKVPNLRKGRRPTDGSVNPYAVLQAYQLKIFKDIKRYDVWKDIVPFP